MRATYVLGVLGSIFAVACGSSDGGDGTGTGGAGSAGAVGLGGSSETGGGSGTGGSATGGASGTSGSGGPCGEDDTCSPPSCDDAVLNGNETDRDCGGSCPSCPNGRQCASDPDCASGKCSGGLCVVPSCNDQVKNGSESGVDCGGECQPCAVGASCMDDDDCVSGACIDGACASPTCTDEVRNGSESAVDCGGSCQGCPDGQGCNGAADCASGVCGGNAECVPASCADEILNGDETDIDCGGACEPCGDGEICTQGSDCGSGVCAEATDESGAAAAADGDLECQAATCLDGVRNGFEADVDCGGSECDPCADGATCSLPADCASRVCTEDQCVPADCGNGLTDGAEQCDDAGSSATCDANCTFAVCGDGVRNTAAGETCDDGNQVTETCAYGRTSCTVCDAHCNQQLGATAFCGDATVNGDEQCDNGVNNGTGCSSDCSHALRAHVLLHCEPYSAVLQTLESTTGCYNLSDNAFSQGPSYILLDPGTYATIYQGTDCTGTFAYVTQDANFCNIADMNDNVRSVRLSAAP